MTTCFQRQYVNFPPSCNTTTHRLRKTSHPITKARHASTGLVEYIPLSTVIPDCSPKASSVTLLKAVASHKHPVQLSRRSYQIASDGDLDPMDVDRCSQAVEHFHEARSSTQVCQDALKTNATFDAFTRPPSRHTSCLGKSQGLLQSYRRHRRM